MGPTTIFWRPTTRGGTKLNPILSRTLATHWQISPGEAVALGRSDLVSLRAMRALARGTGFFPDTVAELDALINEIEVGGGAELHLG